MPIRVAINGVAGRMGRELVVACQRNEALALAAAFGSPGGAGVGMDAGRLAGADECGVDVRSSATMGDVDFDVLVDFSLPEPSIAALRVCLEKRSAMVIGTTGYSADQQNEIDAAADTIGIVQAPNYSAGINLTLDLLRTAAKALGDSVDIEVIEAHHRDKVDAPSGTALRMGEVLAEATNRDLAQCAVYSRHGHTGVRDRSSIGFQTIRGGDIVGEHTVLFAGDGERLEITHRASSRQTFAGGAMRAAAWVAAAAPGHYGMSEVLGLNQSG
ncbi:MAG: 4-hydroxy-tetrahydrodipicolinate reductase [Salinisphaera sp.]|jgi:4-hydroxy-tetrahydrodipicolinate reductase|nr:4-hydroxy-tetrahydrodipicolinate reductase [Salinisphaera sp.]